MGTKAFMHVGIGALCLAAGFAIGARAVRAQADRTIVAASIQDRLCNAIVVVTAAGDVYSVDYDCSPLRGPAVLKGNVWSGPPTGVSGGTWGQLKARYH